MTRRRAYPCEWDGRRSGASEPAGPPEEGVSTPGAPGPSERRIRYMHMSRRVAGVAVGAAVALGVAAPAATAAPAAPAATATPAALGAAPAASTHHHHHAGTRSLVAVLTADKNGFDRNSKDFDILTAAVKAVLAAEPDSAVGVL